MSSHREQFLEVLKKYSRGEIKPRNLISSFPLDYHDDELLDDVINTFCEPLVDCPGVSSWEEVTKICIRAIEEDWTSEHLYDVLENGLPPGG